MKYLAEYRDPVLARRLVHEVCATATQRWSIMEVCGGQTHTLVRQGIDEVLPVRMIHGPGCPVCVTSLEVLDRALAIAARPDVTFVSYGDMLRVPGSSTDLLALKARGADIRIVYSPVDAVGLAAANPDRQVVFFAVGFETTAPANAMALLEAVRRGLENFSMLASHVLVPPAMTAVLEAPDCQVQGFLAAGHVCAVMGWAQYEPIAAKYAVPIVVTGFEPLDLLEGILMTVRQLEQGRAEVENQYARVVPWDGNMVALAAIGETMELRPYFEWRGLGFISHSALQVREKYAAMDAERLFQVPGVRVADPKACQCGEVLKGVLKPWECKVFGTACTPETPIGTCMVSPEGACAAYYNFGRMNRTRVAEASGTARS